MHLPGEILPFAAMYEEEVSRGHSTYRNELKTKLRGLTKKGRAERWIDGNSFWKVIVR